MSQIQSAEEILKKANELFVEEDFESALENYNLAVELDPDCADAFLKRSICFHKLKKYTEAVSDANIAIKLNPNSSKNFLRKGMSCFAMGEFEAAKKAFRNGQVLDDNNPAFKTWIRKCNAELELEGNDDEVTIKDTRNQQDLESSPEKAFTEKEKQSVEKPKIRHEWYQTQTHVIITIFAKKVQKEHANIELGKKEFTITIKLGETSDFQLHFDLFDDIVPNDSSYQFLSTKVEIKLKKATQKRWNSLESQIDESSKLSSGDAKKKKNWDKIVEEAASQMGTLDGEDTLNKVFQDIYSKGSEDQRRAMVKSFVESGGTVLSTNWSEVGQKEVNVSPPQGMEPRKWSDL